MATQQYDVVVVGGGLVGAVMALVTARQGKSVLLLDKQVPSTDWTALAASWDARIFAISPANQDFLAELGVWPQGRCQPVVRMDVRGDAGGRIVFDAADNGRAWLTQMVENRYLLAHVWQALYAAGVAVDTTAATAVRTDVFAAYVSLANGDEVMCRLLVGADGALSWLRTQAGIEVAAKPYHHYGVVANFATEKPHQGCAYQWFKGGEILAYLPLPEQQMSMVWSMPQPDTLTRMAADDLASVVAAQGAHVLGALKAQSRAFAFELVLRQPQSTIAQRVVLIGDAAHTIHPLAGQGVNLGFGDVQCLAALLDGAADVGAWSLLLRYRQQRRLPVRSMQYGCDGLFRLFAKQDYPGLSWLRNTGLNMVNQAPMLKTQLMRQAMGL